MKLILASSTGAHLEYFWPGRRKLPRWVKAARSERGQTTAEQGRGHGPLSSVTKGPRDSARESGGEWGGVTAAATELQARDGALPQSHSLTLTHTNALALTERHPARGERNCPGR